MLFLVLYSLVVDQFFIGFEGDDGLFEVAEKLFYQAGNQKWVFNMLQILIVLLA